MVNDVDRTAWGIGPWNDEGDRMDFRHAGLPCLLLRGLEGHWCGYVGVPPGHWAYGKYYNDVDVDVHGGLTYSAFSDNEIMCHVPEPGEPDTVWWLGFHCGHAGDFVPGVHLTVGVYRSLDYVQHETERFAEQLVERVSKRCER